MYFWAGYRLYTMTVHAISSDFLSPEAAVNIAKGNYQITLSKSALKALEKSRTFLERKIAEPNAVHYGINTGFGALCNTQIPREELKQLQLNLLMSHACGLGPEVPQEIVRLMILVKIQSLCYGHSGVQIATVQRLVDFFNHKVYPVVYTRGSLGASGDLVPLAHLCLPLVGMGEVIFNGERISAKSLHEKMGWTPITLAEKEGLALLNGTQFMLAYGLYLLDKAKHIAELAHLNAAVSVNVYSGRVEPFNSLIHRSRRHSEAEYVGHKVLTWLKGYSPVRKEVQDPYSLRCVPQVHGASLQGLAYVESVLEKELNAVTDNPLLFPDEDLILSGGNFHGQPLALALDHLKICLTELGNISERRTYLLVSGQRGLKPFLAADPGLDSGLMIPQYVAASLVSYNKQLATPASIDSITSSNGQEDYVSMGANAAVQCFEIAEHLYQILAIEFLTAARAFALSPELKPATNIKKVLTAYQQTLDPQPVADYFLSPAMQATTAFLKELDVLGFTS